jgi:hypothetical protein
MNELIEIFEENRKKIETFLRDTILNNFSKENPNPKTFFKNLKSLELVYIVDNKTKKQISPNFYRNKTDQKEINKSREYLFDKIDENSDFTITKPYKSSATGNVCVTIAYKAGEKTVFLDFNLKKLLERLKLLETHSFFDKLTKTFYAFCGFAMMIIAFCILIYSGYKMVFKFDDTIMSFFKPIIYITIAIAVFDLSKTLLEQEVFFKSYKKDENIEKKTFVKFIISILIALSIETLMLVFRISLKNDKLMLNAFWLFAGVSLMILSLSYFIKINR